MYAIRSYYDIVTGHEKELLALVGQLDVGRKRTLPHHQIGPAGVYFIVNIHALILAPLLV